MVQLKFDISVDVVAAVPVVPSVAHHRAVYVIDDVIDDGGVHAVFTARGRRVVAILGMTLTLT